MVINNDYQPIREIFESDTQKKHVQIVRSLALKISEMGPKFYQKTEQNEDCFLSLKNCKDLSHLIEHKNDILILDDQDCILTYDSLFNQAIDEPIYDACDTDPIHQQTRKKIALCQMRTLRATNVMHVMTRSTWNALQEVIKNYQAYRSIHPLSKKCCVIL